MFRVQLTSEMAELMYVIDDRLSRFLREVNRLSLADAEEVPLSFQPARRLAHLPGRLVAQVPWARI